MSQLEKEKLNVKAWGMFINQSLNTDIKHLFIT